MGEDVAECAAGSVVVVGEGTAGRSEGLGALSSSVSSQGASSGGPYPSPGYASSTPLSTACFSFSFSLPSGPPTDRPLKATPKPSKESSLSPLQATEGTGTSRSGSPAGLGAGTGLAGATKSSVVSAVSLVSIFLFALLAQDSSQRAGCTAQGCCRHPEAVCLLLPENFYESFSSCCASPAASCWCRVRAACF